MTDRLPADAPAFADVWRLFVTSDGVVFQTSRAIFRWAHDRMTFIKAASRFGRALEVDGRVYVATPEGGLNVLKGSTLRPLPGTGPIGNEAFPIVLRYDARHLSWARGRRVFLYDGTALTPFPTDADAIFKNTQVSRGIVLPGPTFGIATTGAGLVGTRSVGASGDEGQSLEWPAVRRRVLRDARSGRGALDRPGQRRLPRRDAVSCLVFRSGRRAGRYRDGG